MIRATDDRIPRKPRSACARDAWNQASPQKSVPKMCQKPTFEKKRTPSFPRNSEEN